MNKRKIYLLYLGYGPGGGGQYVRNLLRAFNELQVDIQLITFDTKLIDQSNNVTSYLYSDSVKGWLSIILFAIKRAINTDAIYVFADHRSLRLILLVKLFSPKSSVIYFLQCSLLLKNDCLRRIIRKSLYYFVDLICGVSKTVLKDVSSTGYKGDTAVVYYPISIECGLVERRDIQCEDKTVLLPARIVNGKGHIDLIQASNGKNWNIWFAGEGEYKEKVMSFCKNKSNIHFLGWIYDMQKIYMKSSVVVLPSYSEGLPIVLLEAMKYECPIVAYDIDAIKEIIEDGVTGVLVKTGDKIALGLAVQKVLDDKLYAARLTRSAKSFVEKNHSFQCMTEALGNVLDKLNDQLYR